MLKVLLESFLVFKYAEFGLTDLLGGNGRELSFGLMLNRDWFLV